MSGLGPDYPQEENEFSAFQNLIDSEYATLETIMHFIDENKEKLFSIYEFEADLYTFIHYAVHKGDVEVVKYLLQGNGELIDIKTEVCGRTPLHRAAEKGYYDLI